MFPRSSERFDLLGTEAYRDLLARTIAAAEKSLLLISAFMTGPGIKWICDCGLKPSISATVITQWKPEDILSGASDLDAYTYSINRGWRFGLLPKLHAKLLLVDDIYMFVGSANITARGLSLIPGGNRELGLCVAANEFDIRSALGIANEAVDLSPELFKKMERWIARLRETKKSPSDLELEWPLEIRTALTERCKRLWVADLPWVTPAQLTGSTSEDDAAQILDAIRHDERLFGGKDSNKLKLEVRSSRAALWLFGVLSEEPDMTAYFGRLTQVLHNSLLDDPLPFRKDVKVLLSNLLEYVSAYAGDLMVLDRPEYSMRVRLKH